MENKHRRQMEVGEDSKLVNHVRSWVRAHEPAGGLERRWRNGRATPHQFLLQFRAWRGDQG